MGGVFYLCHKCMCVFVTEDSQLYVERAVGCATSNGEAIHFEPNEEWLELHPTVSVQIERPSWIK
jgi:hypothetical protein